MDAGEKIAIKQQRDYELDGRLEISRQAEEKTQDLGFTIW